MFFSIFYYYIILLLLRQEYKTKEEITSKSEKICPSVKKPVIKPI
jgi:hypothetical protein